MIYQRKSEAVRWDGSVDKCRATGKRDSHCRSHVLGWCVSFSSEIYVEDVIMNSFAADYYLRKSWNLLYCRWIDRHKKISNSALGTTSLLGTTIGHPSLLTCFLQKFCTIDSFE